MPQSSRFLRTKAALTFTALTIGSASAVTRTWNGGTNLDYNVASNWSGGAVPDGSDSGVLNGGGTGVTNLMGGVSPITANALNVRAGHVFNIDNDGGTLNVNANVNMGRGETGNDSTIEHSAGSFNIGGLDMAGNPTGGTSFYRLSGTAFLSLNASGSQDFDIGGSPGLGAFEATFAIEGDSATITLNATPIVLRSSSILEFTLGSTGIDSIDSTGLFTIEPKAEIKIDGSAYTGGAATIPLLTYGSRANPAEFTETIIGFTGFNTDVTYGDNGIDLVLTAVEQETPSSISVNFHSNDSDALEEHRLTSGESAGFLPVDGTGWNNINVGNAQTRTGSSIFFPTILNDDLGNNSGVILSSLLTAGTSGSWFVGYAASSAGDGEELSNGISDDSLFNSYLATNSSDNFDLNISGLGPDFTSEGYHLIIYSDSDRRNTGTQNRRSVYTITSDAGSPMTAFVEDDDGAVAVNTFDGTYLLSDGVDNGADYSNYVIVDGLTSSDFTISIDSPDGGRGAISGFQIIPGALPSSPIITLFEADDQYIQPNSTVQLSWETSDADSLILNPGEMNVTGLTSFTVNPTENTTYTLTATNSDGSSSESVPVAIGPPRPNILLCLVDDWGVMDTSVPFSYDSYTDGASPVVRAFNNFYQTPNLEQLADDGMIFTQAYALPVCSPTRTSLMTGFNAPRHGVTVHLNLTGTQERPGDFDGSVVSTHRSPNAWRFRGMEVTDVTLPRLLSEQGYRSIHCGKGHFGARGEVTEDPTAIGFDINLGGSGAGQPGRYIGNPGYSNGNNPVPNIEAYEANGRWLTDALTEAMNDAITEATDDGVPFFSYMSYYAVHAPFTTNPNATGDYSSGVSNGHRRFASMVEGVDTSLGQIREHLEAIGVAEDTLIIFVGDNGSDSPALRSGNQISSNTFNDYPIRGKKANCYEGGYHVPLFVAWGKEDPTNAFQQQLSISGGTVEHDIVSVVDLPTTILSVADVSHPDMDGVDLSPYLTSTPGTHREQTLLRHQPNSHNSNFFTTYRRDDYKLIYFYYEDPADQFELYDLAVDRDESNNLADNDPQLVLELAREMAAALDASWGELGPLWPTFGTGVQNGQSDDDLRPFVDDPFLIDFTVDGRDLVDSDMDGLRDAIEDLNQNGLVDLTETNADNEDTDEDSFSDGDEVRTGIDPLDRNSFFRVRIEPYSETSVLLTWPSAPGAAYDIKGTFDLALDQAIAENMPASSTEETTSLEVDVLDNQERYFFQIQLLPEN